MLRAYVKHCARNSWYCTHIKIICTHHKKQVCMQSMGLLRVGHDRATSLSLFAFMHWRRKWQPTPVFLPGESQGLGILVGCRLWGRIESDMTEVTQPQQQQQQQPGSFGEGNGTPFQFSCLENPMDGGPWQVAVHVVARSQTGLSGFTFKH